MVLLRRQNQFKEMGKIITVANHKGGVGKTTTSVNLATSLGAVEQTVLFIDADPPSTTTSCLGIDVESVEAGSYQILEQTVISEQAALECTAPHVDLIPANIDSVAIE